MSLSSSRKDIPVCPICFSSNLREFNGRPNASCGGCGSMERGRLLWMVLSRLGLLRRGSKVLNMAPEPFMLSHGRRILGESYTPADYSPEFFANRGIEVRKLDLCQANYEFPDESFDVVIHNHVLEHVCCHVPDVIKRVERLIRMGGYHIFSIPIMRGRKNEEDLSSDLSDQDRKRRFGQEDHVRVFGTDFQDTFSEAGISHRLMDLSTLVSSDELTKWGVPETVFSSPSGHTVFAYQRLDS